MIAGVVQQAMGGILVRARMEARKAAFAGAAAMLVVGALTLAGAAGIVVMSARYGIIVGLLSGAGLLLFFALIAFLVGRRVPGAEASKRAVAAEAFSEDVPAPGAPMPGSMAAEASHAATFSDMHHRVRTHLDGIVPPGSEGVLTQIAAHHLARRPIPTLVIAVAAGAVVGHIKARSVSAPAAEPTPEQDRNPNSEPMSSPRGGRHRPGRRATARRRAREAAAGPGSARRP